MMGMRTDAMQQTLLILAAANEEALRAGHARVDVDHLLLGLLVVDGDAAASLMRAGVSLGSAREALAAQDRDDLRPLGLDESLTDADWLPPVPLQYAAELLPPTDATRAVAKEHPRWRATDLRLLEQLVADPQAPSARLLRRLGIEDPAALATAGKVARRASWSGAGVTRVEMTVPVSADALWGTVADPARRPEWDEDAGVVEILDELAFKVTPRFVVESAEEGRAGWLAGTEVTYRVIDETPGHFVEWEVSYPRREDQKPYFERESIEVTPTDGGTRLTLTASNSRSRSRLVRWLFDWSGRYQLRVRAQALAQVS